MATIMNTQSSLSSTIVMNSIPPALAFLVSNFQSFVSVKLDSSNYFAWKTQVEHALKANGFFEYLDPTHVPSPSIWDDSGTQVPNPERAQWMIVDRMLLSCLIATLTPSVLPYVVGSEYTCQFWIKLEDQLSILSRSHADYLKRGLYNYLNDETGTRSTMAEEEISMDPILYEAAMKGDLITLMANAPKFDSHLTVNKNTVLHVAAEFGKSDCVLEILKASPLLFRRTNIYGETPLHFALEGKFFDVAELLIEHAKSPEVKQKIETEGGGGEPGAALREMLRARNSNGDSALHLAARCKYQYRERVVKLLELLPIRDPELDYEPNNAEETPLFLLVESGFGSELVSQITGVSNAVAYGGPGGTTAMHMAASKGDEFFGSSVEIISILHAWKEHLIKEPDAYGWTPLHFATRFRRIEAIKKLLELDKSLAYVTASNDEGNTALHIAAALGHRDTMGTLLSECPDCWEVVNKKGQNILHIAVDMERHRAVDVIIEKPWVRRAMKAKDNDGNTPGHVLASKMKIDQFERMDLWNLREMEALNKEAMTPLEMRLGLRDQYDWPRLSYGYYEDTLRKDKKAINNWKESIKEAMERKDKVRKEVGEQTRKSAKDHMVVATLIATISFTASFTVPGGFDSNPGPQQGMAILLRELAFKVFVLTNTLTILFSTSSVFLFLSASLFNNQYEEDRQTRRYGMALMLTVVAMVAMTVAFISGTYAMLEHSLGLAIATCVIFCCAFFVYIFEFSTSIRERVIKFIQETRNKAEERDRRELRWLYGY